MSQFFVVSHGGMMTEDERRTMMTIALRLIKEVGEDIKAEAEASGERAPRGYEMWKETGLPYQWIEESRLMPIVMQYHLPDL